jgi:glycine betaine catabolism B
MLHFTVITPGSPQIHDYFVAHHLATPYRIGRHPSCNLVLERPEVSRIHGQIHWQGFQAYYSDLGSTDGSKLNNQDLPINAAQLLHTGDTVQIGEYILLVGEIESGPEGSALAAQGSNSPSGGPSNSPDPLTLRCIQILDQTPEAKTFRWVSTGGEGFTYLPGQFIMADFPLPGQSVTRCYSISSSPARPEVLEITVKRVAAGPDAPEGLVSNWLHRHGQVGMELPMRGIFGDFTWSGEGPVLLISAGSGITPMLSMVRTLVDRAWAADVVFLHSARSPQEIIARAELEFLATQHPQLQVSFTVTQGDGAPRSTYWPGLQGRIDPTMLQRIPHLLDRNVYICGPAAFMAGVKQILLDLGLPPEQYHEEHFGPGPSPQPKEIPKDLADEMPTLPDLAIASPDPSATVEMTQSQTHITLQRGESILDGALRAGIALKHGCKMGVCGVCKLKLLAGAVKYTRDPVALSPQERDYILPCVAQGGDRLRLEG